MCSEATRIILPNRFKRCLASHPPVYDQACSLSLVDLCLLAQLPGSSCLFSRLNFNSPKRSSRSKRTRGLSPTTIAVFDALASLSV